MSREKYIKKGGIADAIHDRAFIKRLELSLFDRKKHSVMDRRSMLFNLQLHKDVVADFGFLKGSSNVHGDFNF